MKPKRKRLTLLIFAMSVLGLSAFLVLQAFDQNLVYFRTPSELAALNAKPGQRIRLGGLVEEGSVTKAEDGLVTRFRVTDLSETIVVRYRGLLPDLFREGQGVVTEGSVGADGIFIATNVLAKHDENYMPKEVADALKKSGKWQGDAARPQ